MFENITIPRIICTAAAVLTLGLSTSAFAANINLPEFSCSGGLTLEKAKTDGVTLGIAPDAPYTYLDENGKPTGIGWKINTAVLDLLGVPEEKIKFSVMPWSSIVPSLLSKKIDIITAGIHENEKRIKVINFSSPSWWYGPAVIVNKNNVPKLDSFKDLKGFKIGALTGTVHADFLEDIGADTVYFKDNFSSFSSLEQGKVPAILDDETKIISYKREHPDSPLIKMNLTMSEAMMSKYGYGYVRYGFRKEDCRLNAAFSRALTELRDNGTVLDIIKEWGFGAGNIVNYPMK